MSEQLITQYKELCQKYQVNFVRYPENKLFKVGMLNYLFHHTSAPYIITYDIDHDLPETSVHDLMSMIVNTPPEVAFVQGKPRFRGKDTYLAKFSKMLYHRFYEIAQKQKAEIKNTLYSGSTAVFKREALKQINGFQQQSFTEDIETCYVLMINGYHGLLLDKVCSYGLVPVSFTEQNAQLWRWVNGATVVLLKYVKAIISSKQLTLKRKIDLLANVGLFTAIVFAYFYSTIVFLYWFTHTPIIRAFSIPWFPFTLLFPLVPILADSVYLGMAVFLLKEEGVHEISYLDLIIINLLSLAATVGFFHPVLSGYLGKHNINSQSAEWNRKQHPVRDGVLSFLIGSLLIGSGAFLLLQGFTEALTITLLGVPFWLFTIFLIIYK